MYEEQYLGMYIELEYNTRAEDNFKRVCPNGHKLMTPQGQFCS
jgi:hypothetical protein